MTVELLELQNTTLDRLGGIVKMKAWHQCQALAGLVMKHDAAEILSIDGHEVRVTHPDKPYFSRQTKLSKLDLVRYYLSVAPGALAGIRDRPLVLKRFVDGGGLGDAVD